MSSSTSSSYISDDSYISQIDKNYFKNISFFSKQFCLPKQIRLNEDRQTIKSVDEGLQIVERESIDDINPRSRNVAEAVVKEFGTDVEEKVRFTNGDGLLSMFKHRTDMPVHVRVMVCITVYSEDKEMLKNTLRGVKENYSSFLTKAGVLSHEIVVVVIFDGIEKLCAENDSAKNMISLFREFDLMNGFKKKEYLMAKQREHGEIEREAEYYDDEKYQLQNYNDDLLFTEKELEELEDNLFQSQYERYMEMCQLVKYIKDLSKKKIQSLTIGELPSQIKGIFMEKARNLMAAHQINNITEDDEKLQKYLEEHMALEKLEMLKLEAIRETERIAKNYLKSRENTAILYQMALPIETNPNDRPESDDPNLRFYEEEPKMYSFFCVKHTNAGKLSSHLWFFEGFCSIIQPDVCILLDCGLNPEKDAIFKMWAHIETYKETCGGVCGYMALNQQNPCDELGYRTDEYDQQKADCLTKVFSYCFDIQKAQMFEYHFAHMLDKPFEACFGYIHVLPGAFSGYNWLALKHEKIKVKKRTGMLSEKEIEKKMKERILRKYLKTVIYNETLDDIKEANMYLAEDRILCLEIYSKKNHAFNLEYLPDAGSRVDPVTSLIRMLGQRKRWINGTWFALEYVLENRKRVNESNHSNWDKFKFRTNMFYSAFNKAMSYIGITMFFIIMHFMIQQFAQNQFLAMIQKSLDIKNEEQLQKAKIFYDFFSIRSFVNSIVGIVDFMYIMAMGVSIFYSLTINRHTDASKRIFNMIATIFGVYGILANILVFYNFISTLINKSRGNTVIKDSFIKQTGALNLDLFIYLFAIIVISHIVIILVAWDFRKISDMISSVPSYFFYAPSYINLLYIYAFCRIDDLSWGTKGLNQTKQSAEELSAKFKNEKLRFVFRWLMINIVLSLMFATLSNSKEIQTALIWIIAFLVIIILLLRVVFALLYLAKYYFFTRRRVLNETLSEYRKLQRIEAGRKIKHNLKNYIEEAKNYGLEEHVHEINEDLRFQSVLYKNIVEEENHVLEEAQEKSMHHQMFSHFNNAHHGHNKYTLSNESNLNSHLNPNHLVSSRDHHRKDELVQQELEEGESRISEKKLLSKSNSSGTPKNGSLIEPADEVVAQKDTFIETDHNMHLQGNDLGAVTVPNVGASSHISKDVAPNPKPLPPLPVNNVNVPMPKIKKPKRESRVNTQKIYVRVGDKNPLLGKIFGAKNAIINDQTGIDFDDLQKIAQLNKMKPKKRNKYLPQPGEKIEEKIDQESEQDEEDELVHRRPKNITLTPYREQEGADMTE